MRLAIHNGHVLGAACLLTPTLAIYAPLSLAPLTVLTAVAAAAVCRIRGDSWPLPQNKIALILATLIFLALVSSLWGIAPIESGVLATARLALMMGSGLVVLECALRITEDERETVGRWLINGMVIAFLALLIDRLTDASIRRLLPMSSEMAIPDRVMKNFDRGISVMALWSFTLAATLRNRGRWLALAAWLAIFVLCLSLPSDAAKLAMLVGGLAVLCSLAWPLRIYKTLAALLVAGTILVPAMTRAIPPPDELPAVEKLPISSSAYHRLLIWRFTADRILERPLLGWGYDSSRWIPGRERNLANAAPALPLHPHNAMLQWWLELGIPGATLGAALLASIAFAIGRLGAPEPRATAIGQLTAAVVVAGLSFGIWQGWWLGALFLTAASFTANLRPP